jgi:hypothetical protein
LFPLRGAGRPQSDPDPLIKLKQHKIRILEGAVPKQEEEAPTPNGFQNQRLKKYKFLVVFVERICNTVYANLFFFPRKKKILKGKKRHSWMISVVNFHTGANPTRVPPSLFFSSFLNGRPRWQQR